jgi:hypothetical protein
MKSGEFTATLVRDGYYPKFEIHRYDLLVGTVEIISRRAFIKFHNEDEGEVTSLDISSFDLLDLHRLLQEIEEYQKEQTVL